MVKTKNTINTIKEKIEREEDERELNLGPNDNDSRYGLWIIALISVVFLLFAFSFLFSGAKITVNPKVKNLTLNQNLNGTKESKDSLSFSVVSFSGEETKSIQGGEEKEVTESAKGTVVIFNTFSASPQILSIDTRLEGSNGKMYKTDSKVTIPGMFSDGTPGSVEVGIYGADVGADYNSSPLDFKIFGFKNSPKYSKFYARSKGEIIGGLVGKVRQISDVEKTTTIDELKNTLQAKLLKKVSDQIPSGYILFKDAVFFENDDGKMGVDPGDGMVPLTLTGTLYGFLFEEKTLTTKIVQENVDKYDGADVYIPNIRDLTFALSNKENISFKDVADISFNLSGPVNVVWKVDEEKIINDVLGKKKKDFNEILSSSNNIDSADLVVKPVWNSSIPDKIKDIKVIVNYPK